MRIAGTPIWVDSFERARLPPPWRPIYLLTHAHAHRGAPTADDDRLTPSWRNGILVCSSVTLALLSLLVGRPPASVVLVDPGETVQLALDAAGKRSVRISALEARPAPGAVMFLLQSACFGTVLHTGSFRWERGDGPLRRLLPDPAAHIDRLYLDSGSSPASAPPRAAAADCAVEFIRGQPPGTRVLAVVEPGFPAEWLLVQIARALEECIVVDAARLRRLRAAKLPRVFSTEPAAGRVRVVSSREFSPGLLRELGRDVRTVGVRLGPGPDDGLQSVPFAAHCTPDELRAVVEELQPARVVPTGLANSGLVDALAAYATVEREPADALPEVPAGPASAGAAAARRPVAPGAIRVSRNVVDIGMEVYPRGRGLRLAPAPARSGSPSPSPPPPLPPPEDSDSDGDEGALADLIAAANDEVLENVVRPATDAERAAAARAGAAAAAEARARDADAAAAAREAARAAVEAVAAPSKPARVLPWLDQGARAPKRAKKAATPKLGPAPPPPPGENEFGGSCRVALRVLGRP